MLTNRTVTPSDPIGTGSLGVLDPVLVAAGRNKTWTLVMNGAGVPAAPLRLKVGLGLMQMLLSWCDHGWGLHV
jgi:hypothetical protein